MSLSQNSTHGNTWETFIDYGQNQWNFKASQTSCQVIKNDPLKCCKLLRMHLSRSKSRMIFFMKENSFDHLCDVSSDSQILCQVTKLKLPNNIAILQGGTYYTVEHRRQFNLKLPPLWFVTSIYSSNLIVFAALTYSRAVDQDTGIGLGQIERWFHY